MQMSLMEDRLKFNIQIDREVLERINTNIDNITFVLKDMRDNLDDIKKKVR